ncbi:molybdopterin converting factor subunit 1 [Pusillimonas sp. CC-YST705]|uniref:Molybdopterin synthase sulfur carrier subunit n=1 Tax=Mesopusillimonas faecipullorum TaxID=2755040 RepID=A0ABS8CCD1_9BURK|nr:molybdopterin converting factor subunit 1 [Mesopusillimonas faecipullorum]MCB5363499.1 molybdopterin converting factor subunit 1 [Mesopusillimonas faecipullorum]
MNGMPLKVLYFARVAELTGVREETWPLAEPLSCQAWLQALVQRYPQLEPARRLKIAVNQQYAQAQTLIQPGDEVAVFEPVTGG